MNHSILAPEVQRFLLDRADMAPSELALSKSPFADVSAAELAQQLDGRQRCRRKLPLWHRTPGIYYPEKVSIEQTSSEATARYKAALIPTGGNLADLTGGFGVDAYFFARQAANVVHCERNSELSRIAQHNAAVLATSNIRFIASDGVSYLLDQPADAFDLVYIDPSRRVQQHKVFRLEDCEPDIVALEDRLLKKARIVLTKAAPLLDISLAINTLNYVREVHVLSVSNECKEVLLLKDRHHAGDPLITAAVLTEGEPRTFAFHQAEEKTASLRTGRPERYLYEPDAALLKAGAFKLIAERYGLKKLHKHTHLYTSGTLDRDFPGRVFQVDQVAQYADFKRSKTRIQANIAARNFPMKADDLRRRHRIDEGGPVYLFFCKGPDDAPLVIFASKC